MKKTMKQIAVLAKLINIVDWMLRIFVIVGIPAGFIVIAETTGGVSNTAGRTNYQFLFVLLLFAYVASIMIGMIKRSIALNREDFNGEIEGFWKFYWNTVLIFLLLAVVALLITLVRAVIIYFKSMDQNELSLLICVGGLILMALGSGGKAATSGGWEVIAIIFGKRK